MMEQNLQDYGLRKALQKPMPYRLPSNFAFRTMQKVDEAVRLKERKQEHRMLFAVVLASVFLLLGCITVITICWGETFVSTFTNLFRSITGLHLLTSPWSILSVLFFLLMSFDHWMRRTYYKHHPKEE